MRALLISLGILAGLFSHATSGWGEPIFFTAVATIVPILLCRRFWSQRWFWLTVALLGVIQIPLVLAARPLIERAGARYTLAFLMADGMFVIVMISLVISKFNRENS